MATVNDRIISLYSDYLKIPPSKFAHELGFTKGLISGLKRGDSRPSYAVLCSILEAYPNISARWLMLGEGDMIDSRVGSSFTAEEPQITWIQKAKVTNGDVSQNGNSNPLLPLLGSNDEAWRKAIEAHEKMILLLEAENARLREENEKLKST